MMDLKELQRMQGEWIGLGTMTVGPNTGDVEEYLRIEATDFPTCFAYIRKSRITFGPRSVTHNELGYLRTTDASLLLSRGSFIILPWSDTEKCYVQSTGSSDSRGMRRAIAFSASGQMVWENSMEVNVQGVWQKHTVNAVFSSILTAAVHP